MHFSEIDFCDPNPCQNGGVCRRLKNDYVCDCPDDVIGLNCEISIEQVIQFSMGTDLFIRFKWPLENITEISLIL
jgi:hypothetical protein